ncbi:MAG: hypothetical protein CVU03_06315 [Bacteroidetes bacterium HGW-Bacteroidetes-2]|jgi:pimeloyl-ACP methyl ester carboxylesterase|nr:MAG: hypothetical protein CVU03_06315 [Bacteroidetes bacterium HGW-Bacteroidetes-2]
MKTLKNSHAIIIGVGHDLPQSVQDAKAMYSILSNPKIAGYKKENITLLTDKLAIRKNITNAFKNLMKNTNEDSSVLIYYSGHGGTFTDNDLIYRNNTGEPLKSKKENNRYYFLQLNDCTIENFEKTWLRAEELKEYISSLKSKRIVLFLDCCHAEGMTKSGTEINPSELKNRLRNPEGLVQKIEDGKGTSILSSCRTDEKSFILSGDPLSLFTTCLVEVLKGDHKPFFDDPYIRLTEVINYLMKKVPERQPLQRPFVNIQMYDDIILSRLPKEKLKKENTLTNTSLNTSKQVEKDIVTIFRKQDAAVNTVLFIHGFSGECATTFDTMQQHIQEDPEMKGWDMYPFGYSENVKPQMGKDIWASVEDIHRVADYLSASIKHKYGNYKRIAIVAHSLGGLAVQKTLLDLDKNDLSRISHVLLFGTPSNGIEVDPSKTLDKRWVDLNKEAPFIKTLRSNWEKTFAKDYPFAFKVVASIDDKDVPLHTNFNPFDKKYQVTIAGNHFSMVQPANKENDSYRLILDTLNNNEFFNRYTNQEEINNLLGEYDTVVKKLMPDKETLNIKGLKQLLFALEGLDRHEEVMNLLLKHPLSQENTDLIGVLGGRLKRKYLQTLSDSDGSKAMVYYNKGLAISTQKNDFEQMYYHAINLAFLSLIYEEDKNKMRKYAQQALEATEKDLFSSLWKNATIAEAAMYCGDFEKATVYYSLAAEAAGLREKISIHTNAFVAYTSLMNTQEDAFTKFLKAKFLT